MYFLFSCRHRASGSHKTNVDSIRYTTNDGPLLDKPKHIGMAHSIHITHRYSTLVGIHRHRYILYYSYCFLLLCYFIRASN